MKMRRVIYAFEYLGNSMQQTIFRFLFLKPTGFLKSEGTTPTKAGKEEKWTQQHFLFPTPEKANLLGTERTLCLRIKVSLILLRTYTLFFCIYNIIIQHESTPFQKLRISDFFYWKNHSKFGYGVSKTIVKLQRLCQLLHLYDNC
uniref:Uncharacterized protein n=1 Tax=Micrurus lemniscatus lemniscatus TaxID=129467 RepID=A0A2D4I4W7_MICLE